MKSPDIFLSGGEDDYLNQWQRILYLHARLKAGGYPTKAELAKRCGVTEKTIQRDFDRIRDEMGGPAEYCYENKGYHYTDMCFEIPAALLSERDLFALTVAENALADFEGTPLHAFLREAFDKILCTLPDGLADKHEIAARAIRFGGMPAPSLDARLWSDLLRACQESRVLEIQYAKQGSRNPALPETRQLEPYFLMVRDRDWFLTAHCKQRQAMRTFYVPRIRTAKVLESKFKLPPNFDSTKFMRYGFNAMNSDQQPQEVTLKFAPEVAPVIEERNWAADQKVEWQNDGSAILKFKATALFSIERMVLQYGGQVKVLAPPELSQQVQAAAQAIINHG